ncbi:unnamed protein product [Peronospora destructor]|uniref:Integrase catalytic domain-containing protein n=1 Tax=Peronospora destructor TaxID=86335 RepID=A0AAV0TXZ6_9STRA|nr:unnamed protein product [Peronospora destructor]
MSAVVGQPLVSGFQEGTLMDFHGRFGHLSFDTIERMAREPESGIKLTDLRRVNCQICAEGKATKSRQPLRDSGTNLPIDRVGGVICSDLKGPITPLDRHGNRYLVNFVDHKTNYVRVSAGKTKDQATKKLDHFLVFFEKHFDCRVHVLRTDGGGEYANVDLLCNRQGVARQVSEAANQASNGKAERMHQTIMNMVRCMIFGSGIALTFWSDAADYAAYILNRSPTRANANRESPLELLTGQVPDLTDIVVFGSPCMVFRDTKKKNFKRHAVRGYIIGKNDETKGYKVLLSKDRKVTTTRHISTIETLGAAANEQIRQALKKLGVDELKRTKNGYSTVVAGGDNARDSSAVSKEELDGLRSARNAKKTAEGSKLRRSMRKKKKSRRQIEADDDEEEVLPPEAEPHLMVLAVVEGSANTPIAPEVEYGPDPKSYREARRDPHSDLWEQAEVEELRSLKANETWTLIKCEPGAKRLHTKHGDVPAACVKAMTEEEYDILLYVPDGMKVPSNLLQKLGVKTLLELNFVQCITDTCIFYKVDSGGTTVIGTYVDDLLVTATSTGRVDAFFDDMQALELKDLGEAAKFLGMQVEPDGAGYALNQESTIAEMLTRFRLENANAARSPIGDEEPSLEGAVALPVISSGKAGLPSIRDFQSLVGSLLWLHLRVDEGIMIPVRISCFTDADFAGDRKDRKSVSAAVIMFNGATVGWHCKKQSAVAVSTAEAEFVAAAAGGQEALGLKELFSELGLQVETPIVLAMDNQAVMKQIEMRPARQVQNMLT